MKIVVYHGSQNNVLVLRPSRIYLTNEIDTAKEIAKGYYFNYDLQKGDVPTVYKMEVEFNNPLYISTEALFEEMMAEADENNTVAYLQSKGYDGIIYTPDDGGAVYYMAVNAKKQCYIISFYLVKGGELMEERKRCCLCGLSFTGWGNSAWPIDNNENHYCCDECNNWEVLPARIRGLKKPELENHENYRERRREFTCTKH